MDPHDCPHCFQPLSVLTGWFLSCLRKIYRSFRGKHFASLPVMFSFHQLCIVGLPCQFVCIYVTGADCPWCSVGWLCYPALRVAGVT